MSKWAEAENGKENKPRVQEFMAAWDSESGTIMLSSLKEKKIDDFLPVLGLCCCTWDFSSGNEQAGATV